MDAVSGVRDLIRDAYNEGFQTDDMAIIVGLDVYDELPKNVFQPDGQYDPNVVNIDGVPVHRHPKIEGNKAKIFCDRRIDIREYVRNHF